MLRHFLSSSLTSALAVFCLLQGPVEFFIFRLFGFNPKVTWENIGAMLQGRSPGFRVPGVLTHLLSSLLSESLAQGCVHPLNKALSSVRTELGSPHQLTLFRKNTQDFANSRRPTMSLSSRETPAKDQDHPAWEFVYGWFSQHLGGSGWVLGPHCIRPPRPT